MAEGLNLPKTGFEGSLRGPYISGQLGEYLRSVQRTTGLSETRFGVVLDKAMNYLRSRHERGEELQSDEVRRARTIAQQYYNEITGEETFVGWDLCMDSRTRKTLLAGIPGKFGGSLRYPGGKPPGFTRDDNGSLTLDSTSPFAKAMRNAARENQTIFQVVDSHTGCAARGNEERERLGQDSPDGGLLEDIRFKSEVIQATSKYVRGLNPDANIELVQVNFDPHNGFMNVGLEKDESIAYAITHGGHFTPANLGQLESPDREPNERILSTKTLANTTLLEIFNRYQFNLDWMKDYKNSALNFWRNIAGMRNEALPLVREKVNEIYPNLRENNSARFEFICRLALLNSYSGWLNNLNKKYPYDAHNESLVVAVEGGDHGPFPIAEALEVSRDSEHIREDTRLGTTIIVSNRTAEPKRAPGEAGDPIPLIVQAALSTSVDTERLMKMISRMQKDLPALDWRSWKYHDFVEFARDSYDGDDGYHVTADFAIEFAKLGMTMQKLYDNKNQFHDLVRTGRIIPIPILVGPHRKPLAIIPFLPGDVKAA